VEIRNLRHLTREPSSDPNLKAYYQFNETVPMILDKVGIAHATFNGNADRIESTAPVGGGISMQLVVNSGGNYSFGNTGVSVWFPPSGTYPQGEIVVSKLGILPDTTPAKLPPIPLGFWIINNYGSNGIFSPLDSLFFNQAGFMSQYMADSLQYKLFTRQDNDDGSTWKNVIKDGSSGIAGMTGDIRFHDASSVTEFGQFIITRDSFRMGAPKVVIADPPDTETMMRGGSSVLLSTKTTNQGIKLPVFNQTRIENIKSPEAGLLAYDGANKSVIYFNGSSWRTLLKAPIGIPEGLSSAGNPGPGIGIANIDSSSILHMSDDGGMVLLPTFDTLQSLQIKQPLEGMLLYNANSNKINCYNGSAWAAYADSVSTYAVNLLPPEYSYPGVSVGSNLKSPNAALQFNDPASTWLLCPVSPALIRNPVEGLFIYSTEHGLPLIFDGSNWNVLMVSE
jgi:hypothetical protein